MPDNQSGTEKDCQCVSVRDGHAPECEAGAKMPDASSRASRVIEVRSCRGECPYECEQTGTCRMTTKRIDDPASIPDSCPLPHKHTGGHDCGVEDLQKKIDRLERDLEFERSGNKFDATRLRRVASLLKIPVPDDKTLLACAGTVLGSVAREIEELVHKDRCSKCGEPKTTLDCWSDKCVSVVSSDNLPNFPLEITLKLSEQLGLVFGLLSITEARSVDAMIRHAILMGWDACNTAAKHGPDNTIEKRADLEKGLLG